MRQILLCASGMLVLSACGLNLMLGYPDEGDAGNDASTIRKDASAPDAKPDATVVTDASLDASMDAPADAPVKDGSVADADADVDASKPTRRVFLTSANYTGAEVGGLVGADAICTGLAASLAGNAKWHAILGQDQTYADIISRVGNRVAPIVLVDGTAVTPDITKLVTAKPNLTTPINMTEAKAVLPGAFAWTGISADGNNTGESTHHCVNWTSVAGAADGVYGEAGKKNAEFLMVKAAMGLDACTVKHRLYCIEE